MAVEGEFDDILGELLEDKSQIEREQLSDARAPGGEEGGAPGGGRQFFWRERNRAFVERGEGRPGIARPSRFWLLGALVFALPLLLIPTMLEQEQRSAALRDHGVEGVATIVD